MQSQIRGLPLIRLLFRRRLFVWAAFIIGITVFAGFWLTAEPKHAGTSLTEWLSGAPLHPIDASNAVVQIGPRAVPLLLRKIQTREPSSFLHDALRRMGIDDPNAGSAYAKREIAVRGFEILGERCASAIPRLVALLADQQCGPQAAQALRAIGERAAPFIEESLLSTNAEVKRNLVRAVRLGRSPMEATELFRLSTNSDPVIRAEVLLCLTGHLPRFQEQVSSTIWRACDDPDPVVQQYAAIALRLLGDLGTNALPKLYTMTNSQAKWVAAEAQQSVKNLEKRMRLNAMPAMR
jgi:hypothetical protein